MKHHIVPEPFGLRCAGCNDNWRTRSEVPDKECFGPRRWFLSDECKHLRAGSNIFFTWIGPMPFHYTVFQIEWFLSAPSGAGPAGQLARIQEMLGGRKEEGADEPSPPNAHFKASVDCKTVLATPMLALPIGGGALAGMASDDQEPEPERALFIVPEKASFVAWVTEVPPSCEGCWLEVRLCGQVYREVT